MKKKIPYAVASFEEIREKDYFFVDKTSYIEELENYKVPVFLRPRRFGKSLWCSLLECYYDINRADRFDFLFKDLYIGENPTPERNKYLVMRLDFSKVEVKPDMGFIESSFNSIFLGSIEVFLAHYSKYLADFSYNNKESASAILSKLTDYIQKHTLPPIYLIIDEYDNFANQLITSHQDGLYYELTTGESFFRTLFKVMKAGVGERAIEKVFITGILPITMDDLTSGFNIAEFITLKQNILNMLGFTQNEADNYLEGIYDVYGFDTSNLEEVRQVVLENYNGYKFLPDTQEKLYNSTILTYFLKSLVLDGGKLPREIIDENLRTDISWIKQLGQKEEDAREMLETLLFEKELGYDKEMISSRFNMHKFFEKDFYPLSLFYLGMLTFKDEYTMQLPNLSMRKIFTDYFNTIEEIEVSKGYTDIFRTFMQDLDIERLFKGYWDVYVGQLPAQIFDRVNENFYRTTFYELCTRYLSHAFTFAIENNYPSGRSDWEMLGKFHTRYRYQKYLIEFKYYSHKEDNQLKILRLQKPIDMDVAQVKGYVKDIKNQFPYFTIHSYLIYIVSNKGFKSFNIGRAHCVS